MNSISSFGGIISGTFKKWSKNYSWLTSTVCLFALQLIMGLAIGILMVVGLVGSFSSLLLTGDITSAFNPSTIVAFIVIFILMIFMGVFINNGFVRASINFGRTGKYQMEDFFTGYKNYVPVLLASLLTGIIAVGIMLPFLLVALFGGVLLTVIAGIALIVILSIFQFSVMLTVYLINDKQMRVIEALKESINLMKGYKARLFGATFIVSLCTMIPIQIISYVIMMASTLNGNPAMGMVFNYLGVALQLFVSSFLISMAGYFYVRRVDGDEQVESEGMFTNQETFNIEQNDQTFDPNNDDQQ